MTLELKKYCIEAAKDTSDIVGVAKRLYEWLVDTDVDASSPDVTDLPELTEPETRVLNQSVTWYLEGEPIKGTYLNARLRMTTGSFILRKLVSKGYMHRSGNKFTPLYKVDGTAIN